MNLGKLSLSFVDFEPRLVGLHLEEGIDLSSDEVVADWLLEDQP